MGRGGRRIRRYSPTLRLIASCTRERRVHQHRSNTKELADSIVHELIPRYFDGIAAETGKRIGAGHPQSGSLPGHQAVGPSHSQSPNVTSRALPWFPTWPCCRRSSCRSVVYHHVTSPGRDDEAVVRRYRRDGRPRELAVQLPAHSVRTDGDALGPVAVVFDDDFLLVADDVEGRQPPVWPVVRNTELLAHRRGGPPGVRHRLFTGAVLGASRLVVSRRVSL